MSLFAEGELPPRRPWLAVGLVVLTLLALGERCLRMNDSLWGDECMSLRGYVTGHLTCTGKDHLHGRLKWVRDPWTDTIFSDDSGGNNHYFYSIIARATLDAWRSLAKQPAGAFSEAVLRFWPLMAGLATLWAMAGWMRRLGAPAGVAFLAAVLMALHPWHLRFSTEARGYMLMLLFFILALRAWTDALERGRWRDWITVAITQFLALYSWKGVMYPLIGLNVTAGALMWFRLSGEGRRIAMGRWLAVSGVSGALFVPLVSIAQVQLTALIPSISRRGNEPLNLGWVQNLCCETLFGFPARIADAANPEEVSFHRLWQMHPLLTGVLSAVILLTLVAGIVWLLRRNAGLAALMLAIPAGGLLAMAHFKIFLNIELLRWYWFFATPVVALFLALGAGAVWRNHALRRAGATAVVIAFGLAVWPIRRFDLTHPYEDFRGAAAVARGKDYLPWRESAPNRVKTVWIWRFGIMYDPRGVNDADSPATLRNHIAEARREGMEFFLVDGYPMLTAKIVPEVQQMLDDPVWFEKIAVFWGQMPQQTMFVYKARAGAPLGGG